jgi:hypothetical protein
VVGPGGVVGVGDATKGGKVVLGTKTTAPVAELRQFVPPGTKLTLWLPGGRPAGH